MDDLKPRILVVINSTEMPVVFRPYIFARMFYYNVRDLKQFEKKGNLPVCCNGLQKARKKGGARPGTQRFWDYFCELPLG